MVHSLFGLNGCYKSILNFTAKFDFQEQMNILVCDKKLKRY